MTMESSNTNLDTNLEEKLPEEVISSRPDRRKFSLNLQKYWLIITLITFVVGSLGGFGIGRYSVHHEMAVAEQNLARDIAGLADEVFPPDGYQIPAKYGNIGPELVAFGVIDYDAIVSLYEKSGQPLTEDQLAILTQESDQPIIINSQNAYFLLNLFWAFGLANANPILTEGPITQHGQGDVTQFASTGGWGLGTKPVNELFAGTTIVTLTADEQLLVEKIAALIYRPCCNNPTLFPDCNHGMAMLGLLELMAAQGAGEDEMLEAAKSINAFWYPQQAFETALYLKYTQDINYSEADPKIVVGDQLFSGSGFAAVHQWLQSNGKLEQAPGGANSCSN
jgi:hypothetical protein